MLRLVKLKNRGLFAFAAVALKKPFAFAVTTYRGAAFIAFGDGVPVAFAKLAHFGPYPVAGITRLCGFNEVRVGVLPQFKGDWLCVHLFSFSRFPTLSRVVWCLIAAERAKIHSPFKADAESASILSFHPCQSARMRPETYASIVSFLAFPRRKEQIVLALCATLSLKVIRFVVAPTRSFEPVPRRPEALPG